MCPVRLSAGNSPHRKNPAEPVKREAEEGWGKARGGDLYDRIRALMDAYIRSPEGAGEDASTLMSRLAACVADVIPMAVRKRL